MSDCFSIDEVSWVLEEHGFAAIYTQGNPEQREKAFSGILKG